MSWIWNLNTLMASKINLIAANLFRILKTRNF